MTITKIETGWRVDVWPDGRYGRRVRKILPSRAEAARFENWIKSQAASGDWNPAPSDCRTLYELCELWYQMHGKHLRDGHRRLRKLELICNALNNPRADRLTPGDYLRYRAAKNAQPKTLNNELGYINAVYNELHRTQQITFANPLSSVKPIKLDQNELSFLTSSEITELLQSIETGSENPHLLLITKICLATGCRWSEAESLHTRQIRKGKITFTETKSKKNRTVPISPALEKEIKNHGEGQLFTSAITAFRRALARTSIELPKGQAAHVLRHTFASHFMMNGGDILTLQRILGHSSIAMTMRYAHLSPGHLAEAVTLNPLEHPNL
ncbi:tyrosine-type recombinase/integrase [Teredinibacter turnerae]|uniref:phage integrase n=1 Tax=Teredinibacter turnerae TaxID=2426 RepID=UPI00036B7FD7|nr:tyrosine-type recombinase/integrase [Teredinibacter turnerae]